MAFELKQESGPHNQQKYKLYHPTFGLNEARSQTNMNHMDDGIFANREAVILHEAQIADAQKEIKVLKDATLNNMTNNVFLINFDSVNSVAITSGIYDPVARKLYV